MRQTETSASHQRTASDVARRAGAGALSDATRVERAFTMRIRAARPRPARPAHSVRAVIASSDAQCAGLTGTQVLQRWIDQVPSPSGGTAGAQWDATTAEASLHATSTFAWDEGTQTIRRDGDLPPDEGQTAGGSSASSGTAPVRGSGPGPTAHDRQTPRRSPQWPPPEARRLP
ncbi:MAG: hypothetical protein ACFWTS_03510 [Pseudoclavibacter caeni]|jgi:hypothetical protein